MKPRFFGFSVENSGLSVDNYRLPRLQACVSMSERIFRFETLELNTGDGELRSNSSRLRLQEKPVRLLCALLDKPQQMVTREELRRRMWSDDTFVDFERGINVAIKKVRDALGDSAENPKFIETIAKKGYRFLVPVEVVTGEPGAATPVAHTGAEDHAIIPAKESNLRSLRDHGWMLAILCVALFSVLGFGVFVDRVQRGRPAQIHSVAVLPLRNLSPDSGQEYFADGVTEDLITSLAQSVPLRVISRTSVMRYKETSEPITQIARELGVDTIVEGAVARAGNRVSVTVQLIDATQDRHLWAHRYDRQVGDLLEVEAGLSQEIVRQIGSTLRPREEVKALSHPVDSQAYDLYLRGRYLWNQRTDYGVSKAAEYFQEAVNLDPDYAQAYVGLADCYLFGVPQTDPPNVLATKAKAMLKSALQLDDSLGEAHASLGLLAQNQDRDWAAAEREYSRAIQLNPNYATAHQWHAEFLTLSRNFDQAAAEMKLASELDPLSLVIIKDNGEVAYAMRDYARATQYLRKALEIDANFIPALRLLAMTYVQTGELSKAVAELKKALDLEDTPDTLAELGYVYALSGRRQESVRVLRELRAMSHVRYVSPRDYALVYVALGDMDKAFLWLDRASREGSQLVELRVDPRWDALRPDVRFAHLMKGMGLAL